MVGFISEPTIEGDLNQPSRFKDSTDPPDHFDPKITDVSFADSLLDFDSIKEWFEDTQTIDLGALEMADEGDVVRVENPERNGVEFGAVVMADEGSGEKVLAQNPIVNGSDLIVDGSGAELKVEGVECEKLGKLSFSIDQDMGKASLAGETGNCGILDGNEVKTEMVSSKEKSISVSESETTGSSSSVASSSESSSESSNSDDTDSEDDDEEEEKEVKTEVNLEAEVEEGEIRDPDGGQLVAGNDEDEEDDDDDNVDNMVTWSDVEDEDDGGGGALKPIKSKNEVEVLPPVPPVDVALQSNHQMQPVGVVLSIIGAKVIVEGVEKHNPLSEGSILWITEKRSPLGLIDEIFGPVKNPYYVVRYNSESEIPAGLQDGSLISFVPEFANHVLNDQNLYKKGYDASGDNDEEVSDEAEFSDDEKEAEYKRMQKMAKRGMNELNLGNGKNNRKKGKNRDGPWKNNKPSSRQTTMGPSQLPPDQNQHHIPPDQNQRHIPPVASSFSTEQGFAGGTGMIPQFPQTGQAGSFAPISNGAWTNGMQYQQPQGAVFPNGFPAEGMPLLLQNPFQHPYQMPMPSRMPFQQQFDPSQGQLPCASLPLGQPNFFPGSACAPWAGFMGQNGFNPTTFGMGLQGQQLLPPTNAGGQVIMPHGLQGEQNSNLQPPSGIQGNVEASRQFNQQFNQGASSGRGRGRKPYHRGGGRFAGGRGRGRQQSN